MGKQVIYTLPAPVVFIGITNTSHTINNIPANLLGKRIALDYNLVSYPGGSTTSTSRVIRHYCASGQSIQTYYLQENVVSLRRKLYIVLRGYADGEIICSMPAIPQVGASYGIFNGTDIYRGSTLNSNGRIGIGVQHSHSDEVTIITRMQIYTVEIDE